MASSISLASPILLVILFHLLFETNRTCFASNPTQKTPTGHRFTLTRVGFGNKIHKNRHALNSLRASSITSRVNAHEDEYVMQLTSGIPPVKFSAIVDTGSDLIWTKCKRNTSSHTLSENINSCDTFQLPGAVCEQKYADGKSIIVNIVKESLTIGHDTIPNITFGCGIPSNKDKFPYGGVVGMGRGKLSLVSQLNENVFSYCLTRSSEKSILLTGSLAMNSMANSDVQMPLLKHDQYQSYYYISLEGISVGNTRLSVNKADFAIKSDGTGGMIIDSGTTFTYLENDIINMIENEFMNQTKLEISKDENPPYEGLNRCFNSPYDVKIVPKLVFHFSGADWDVPRENYIYEKKDKACLAFIANDKKDAQKISIFGNMQQRNMMVLYDLDNNSLSFKTANCNQL